MSTVKERLKEFISYLGIGQGKFEKAVGLSNGYVNSISKGIGADKLQRILGVYPQLNQVWLLTGEGGMLTSSDSSPHAHIGDVRHSNVAVNGNVTINDKEQAKRDESLNLKQEEVMENSVPIEVFKMVMESNKQQLENQKQQVEKFTALIQEQKTVIDHLMQRLSARVDASEEKNEKLLAMYDKLHKWQEEHEKKTDEATQEIITKCATLDITPFIQMKA